MKYNNILFCAMAMLFFQGIAIGQSVEAYAGHQRVGVDLMWFKNFKNNKDERSPFLFFSRNRASVDYNNAPTAFGSTNALSYNFKNGLGFVTVASFLNSGFTPKAGVQLYKSKGPFMFFGWLVTDIRKNGNLDLFGLFRYQPVINGHWKGFGQIELFPVYTPSAGTWNLTQRVRLGARYQLWAAGFMADFNQLIVDNTIKTSNVGGFLRYDF